MFSASVIARPQVGFAGHAIAFARTQRHRLRRAARRASSRMRSSAARSRDVAEQQVLLRRELHGRAPSVSTASRTARRARALQAAVLDREPVPAPAVALRVPAEVEAASAAAAAARRPRARCRSGRAARVFTASTPSRRIVYFQRACLRSFRSPCSFWRIAIARDRVDHLLARARGRGRGRAAARCCGLLWVMPSPPPRVEVPAAAVAVRRDDRHEADVLRQHVDRVVGAGARCRS